MTISLITRGEFVTELRLAARNRRGFAMGKLGTSEKYWMYYEVVLARERDARRRHAYETALRFHALKQSGVFPPTPAFIREFNRMYVASMREIDCVGLVRDRLDLEDGIIGHYGLTNRWMHFLDQEPDRSVPARDDACYLPAFAGLKVLFVSPFAELLKARATPDVFERVWAKTGKRWFAPASVDALGLPYGYDRSTHERFATALDLHRHVADELARRDFDVALIGAGGLGIPLAASVKQLGRIGLSLGGHLQVLFGVLGQRWRNDEWRGRYVTDAWIDMPAEYRPQTTTGVFADEGAYW